MVNTGTVNTVNRDSGIPRKAAALPELRRRSPVTKPGTGWVFRRGDIYIANLNPFKGSEQGGTRPVLVLQNDTGNHHCPTLIVAPVSSILKKRRQPTHVLLKKGRGLAMDSVVELEQIRTIDKSRVQRYIGRVTPEQMAGVGDAVRKSLGL